MWLSTTLTGTVRDIARAVAIGAALQLGVGLVVVLADVLVGEGAIWSTLEVVDATFELEPGDGALSLVFLERQGTEAGGFIQWAFDRAGEELILTVTAPGNLAGIPFHRPGLRVRP